MQFVNCMLFYTKMFSYHRSAGKYNQYPGICDIYMSVILTLFGDVGYNMSCLISRDDTRYVCVGTCITIIITKQYCNTC